MASTTALTMVNRLLRRHGWEDYTTFTEPETLLALDLVNQAIRDLLMMRDYPWNIRSDGTLRLRAPLEDTDDGCTVTAASATIAAGSYSGTETDYTGGANAGVTVSKLLVTGASSHTTTAMQVLSVEEFGGALVCTLNGAFPGGNQTNKAFRFYFDEYVLGDTVAKVVSVRHQDQPVRLLEAPAHTPLDEILPRRHDAYGPPELVAIGGTATATYDEGAVDAGTEGLRLVVWPPPDARYMLNYSYKERIAALTTTTSTLVAPDEFVDDVIDRAEALSNMTQRFNSPELAQQQLRNTMLTAERKWTNSQVDPSRRHGLKSIDSGGNRRRDPTSYKDIDGL